MTLFLEGGEVEMLYSFNPTDKEQLSVGRNVTLLVRESNQYKKLISIL